MCIKLMKMQVVSADLECLFFPSLSTEAGRLMAWYYITFETVKKFCTISGKETLSDLVN